MIHIAPEAHAAILAHAERAWPRECCGLLAGCADTGAEDIFIRRAEPARNLDDSGRNDRFELDPQARFNLMRELEGGPEKLIGHYHSHPDGTAEPSVTDRAMAHEPDLIWLICAVRDSASGASPGASAGPVRAFRITGGPSKTAAVRPLELIIRECEKTAL